MEYDEKHGPWVEPEESSPDKEVAAGCRSGSDPGPPPGEDEQLTKDDGKQNNKQKRFRPWSSTCRGQPSCLAVVITAVIITMIIDND